MALEWDVSKIKDHQTVTTSPETRGQSKDCKWHTVTDTIVWLCGFCGVSEITAANAKEVANRFGIYEQIMGPLLSYHDPEKPEGLRKVEVRITKADVEKHIGLKVWSRQMPAMTKAKFNSEMMRRMWRRAEEARDGIGKNTLLDGRSAYDIVEALAAKNAKEQEAEASLVASTDA